MNSFENDIKKYTTLSLESEEDSMYLVAMCKNQDTCPNKIIYNQDKTDIDGYGEYEIWCDSTGEWLFRIEDFFLNPLNPTDEELELYKLENGVEYQLLPYLKR